MLSSRRLERLVAAVLPAFFLITSLYIASKRLFWFDEIGTVEMARLPGIGAIWQALTHGWELQPLPYYVIVRISESIFGRGELAARLPCALGVALGMYITFFCARRLSDPLHGLIAQAILGCSFLPFYGYEARPYGIYFAFSAVLLWVWLSYDESSRRGALWFGLIFLLATSVHYYFILCWVPYAFYDIVCRRRVSSRIIAGVMGATLALAGLAPQIFMGYRVGAKGVGARPTIDKLQEIYQGYFPGGLFLLAMVALWIALANARDKSPRLPMSDGERGSWFSVLIPVAGFVMAYFVTRSFYDRYFIGALPGIAVAFACLLYRGLSSRPILSWVVLVLFAVFGIAHQARKALRPELIQSYGDYQDLTREALKWEEATLKDGKQYIATDRSRLIWLTAWYYSKHRDRYAVLLEPGDGAWGLVPMHYWTLDDLKRHSAETAFIAPLPFSLQNMKDAGLQPVVRAAEPLQVLYFSQKNP